MEWGAGGVTVAAGRWDGWCTVTVAHALVHGIRGTVGNRLFRLYVGQEWLSPAALSMEQQRKRKRKSLAQNRHIRPTLPVYLLQQPVVRYRGGV